MKHLAPCIIIFPVLFSVDICLNLTVQINCQMSLYNHTEMLVPRVDRQ